MVTDWLSGGRKRIKVRPFWQGHVGVSYDFSPFSYDDPGKTKQSHSPNARALQNTLVRAEAFFRRHLQP